MGICKFVCKNKTNMNTKNRSEQAQNRKLQNELNWTTLYQIELGNTMWAAYILYAPTAKTSNKIPTFLFSSFTQLPNNKR